MKIVLVIKNGSKWSSLMDILSGHPVIYQLRYADTYTNARKILLQKHIDAVFIILNADDRQGP